MKPSYIYKITNQINNKCYIGFTQYIKDRKGHHKHMALKQNIKSKLYNAIRKYGWENFTFEILYCSKDREHCLNMEIQFIVDYDTLVNGYNILAGGQYQKFTKEIKTKISNAAIKQWQKQNNMLGWKVIYPDGKEEFVTNLSLFCKTHNLQEDNLYNVARGKRKHHKNFRATKILAEAV